MSDPFLHYPPGSLLCPARSLSVLWILGAGGYWWWFSGKILALSKRFILQFLLGFSLNQRGKNSIKTLDMLGLFPTSPI